MELPFRNPKQTLLVFAVLILAAIAGVLTGLDAIIGILILACILVASLTVSILRIPSLGILFVFLVIVGIDIFRRVVAFYTGSWSLLQLLPIDAVLMVIFISLYVPFFVRQGKFHIRNPPLGFKILLGLYLFWIAVQLFNPTLPSLMLSLVGIRTYLFPVLVLGTGWYVMDKWNDREWRNAFVIVFFTSIGVVIFGIIAFAIERETLGNTLAAAILSPAEHGIHSWETGNVRLVSSVFASSKRFGRYLLMTFPFLWIYLDKNEKHGIKSVVFLVYLVGCFVSGSREALILMVMVFLLLGNWLKRIGQLFLIVVSASAVVILLAGPEEVQRRLEFTASTPEDWSDRVEYMTIAPVVSKFIIHVDTHYVFGIGPGRFGGSSQLYEVDFESSIELPDNPYYDEELLDAGLYKIFVELGAIGLVIFLGFKIYILLLPWRHDINNPYIRASAIAFVVWFILFLKAHTVLDDSITMVFFWFYVGLTISAINQSGDGDHISSHQAKWSNP